MPGDHSVETVAKVIKSKLLVLTAVPIPLDNWGTIVSGSSRHIEHLATVLGD
jgi:hypothetical protein